MSEEDLLPAERLAGVGSPWIRLQRRLEVISKSGRSLSPWALGYCKSEGLRFAIREGGRTVGVGRVTKIVK